MLMYFGNEIDSSFAHFIGWRVRTIYTLNYWLEVLMSTAKSNKAGFTCPKFYSWVQKKEDLSFDSLRNDDWFYWDKYDIWCCI